MEEFITSRDESVAENRTEKSDVLVDRDKSLAETDATRVTLPRELDSIARQLSGIVERLKRLKTA